MSSERIQRVQELFLLAVEVPSQERDDWLRDHCEDDDLRKEVKSLLQHHGRSEDPLEQGVAVDVEGAAATLGRHHAPDVPGYRIVRELGTGGQSVVFEAVQESTTQRVAIKMLRWGSASTSHERDRFDREVMILSKLKHPNILSIIDRGETERGAVFLVTEFVDGAPLDRVTDRDLGESEPVGNTGILRIFLKVASAVEFAHRAGIIHRDLKPSNVLIDQNGEPRILDFGLAKPAFGANVNLEDVRDITLTGHFLGSLPWASPEQAKGEPVDARSDVYSLGVILYQVVTGGRFPYKVAGNIRDVLDEIINTQPTPPSQKGLASAPGESQKSSFRACELINADVEAIVLKALAKSPEQRYQSAGELAADIQRYLAGRPIRHEEHAGREAPKATSRRLHLTMGFLVLAVIGALWGATWFVGDKNGNEFGHSRQPENRAENRDETWISLEGRLIELQDEESISEKGNGWIVARREVSFPSAAGRSTAIRGRVRRLHQGSATISLRSVHGMQVDLVFRGWGELQLLVPGKNFAHAEAAFDAGFDEPLEFAFAILNDRAIVAVNGHPVMQLHFVTLGKWLPVLDVRDGVVELDSVEYCKVDQATAFFHTALRDEERPTVEYVLSAGCSASSMRVNEASREFSLTTLVALENVTMPAEIIERLGHCRSLKELSVREVDGSSESLAHLGRLRDLKRLGIWQSRLDGQWLDNFADAEHLEGIDLWMTTIERPDFRSLSSLGRLQFLAMTDVEITDDHLRQISDAKSLQVFMGNGRTVTAVGVSHLGRLPHLERLELAEARLSGEGVKALSSFPRLNWLDVRGSDLADSDTEHLRKLRGLRRLNVENTQMTNQGLQQLAQSLTECEITPAVTLELETRQSRDGNGTRVSRDESTDSPRIHHDVEAVTAEPWIDAEAAQWILRQGGTIEVRVDGKGRELKPTDTLPQGDIVLYAIVLQGVTVADSEFARMRGLRHVQKLDLRGCRALIGTLLSYFTACNSLEYLDLAYSGCDDTISEELHRFSQLRHLDFTGTKITDHTMRHLASLSQVEFLGLGRTSISDDGIRHLGSLRNLEILGLNLTGVGDGCLPHLKALPRLRHLTIQGGNITDVGAGELAKLTDLRYLVLQGTKLGNEGLRSIAQLTKLTNLDVSKTSVSDEGLGELGKLKSLVALNLASTEITDAGLGVLRELSALRGITLDNTAITDIGVNQLAKLAGLQRITLTGTGVTPEGAARIKSALPGCVVVR